MIEWSLLVIHGPTRKNQRHGFREEYLRQHLLTLLIHRYYSAYFGLRVDKLRDIFLGGYNYTIVHILGSKVTIFLGVKTSPLIYHYTCELYDVFVWATLS